MNQSPAPNRNILKRLVLVAAVMICTLLVLLPALKKEASVAGSAPASEAVLAQTAAAGAASSAQPISSTALPSQAAVASNRPSIAASGQGTNISREFDIHVNPYAAGLREPGRSRRAWEVDFLERHQSVAVGDPIEFELTDGVMASGRVKILQRDDDGIKYISGELSAPEAGEFFFLRPPVGGRAGSAVGVIQFPTSETAYRIEPTGDDGAPELWQRRLDEVICMGMEPADEETLGETMEATLFRCKVCRARAELCCWISSAAIRSRGAARIIPRPTSGMPPFAMYGSALRRITCR